MGKSDKGESDEVDWCVAESECVVLNLEDSSRTVSIPSGLKVLIGKDGSELVQIGQHALSVERSGYERPVFGSFLMEKFVGKGAAPKALLVKGALLDTPATSNDSLTGEFFTHTEPDYAIIQNWQKTTTIEDGKIFLNYEDKAYLGRLLAMSGVLFQDWLLSNYSLREDGRIVRGNYRGMLSEFKQTNPFERLGDLSPIDRIIVDLWHDENFKSSFANTLYAVQAKIPDIKTMQLPFDLSRHSVWGRLQGALRINAMFTKMANCELQMRAKRLRDAHNATEHRQNKAQMAREDREKKEDIALTKKPPVFNKKDRSQKDFQPEQITTSGSVAHVDEETQELLVADVAKIEKRQDPDMGGLLQKDVRARRRSSITPYSEAVVENFPHLHEVTKKEISPGEDTEKIETESADGLSMVATSTWGTADMSRLLGDTLPDSVPSYAPHPTKPFVLADGSKKASLPDAEENKKSVTNAKVRKKSDFKLTEEPFFMPVGAISALKSGPRIRRAQAKRAALDADLLVAQNALPNFPTHRSKKC